METTIRGVRVRYEDTGTGQAVVLLHGWGSSLDAYNLMARALEGRYRVVRLDFPGFGGSESLPEPWSLEDYQNATAEFLGQLDLRQPVLVGHSCGGRVILRMCGNGLVKPSKIILIDSSGIRPKPTLRGRIRTAGFKTAKWFLTHGPWKKAAAPTLERVRAYFGSADYNAAPPVLRQTLVRVVNEDLKEYLPRLSCPTLLIWGEKDTATPLSDAKTMERMIPDAGLCVIRGAGHFSFVERPGEVHAIVHSFLQS